MVRSVRSAYNVIKKGVPGFHLRVIDLADKEKARYRGLKIRQRAGATLSKEDEQFVKGIDMSYICKNAALIRRGRAGLIRAAPHIFGGMRTE